MLTKEMIMSAQDFEIRKVDVPEWGGEVNLRGLSSADRDNFEAEVGVDQDMKNLRARLVVKAIVDDDGKRIFGDKEAALLGQKSADVIVRLFEVVREMNGMGDADLEAAQEK